MKGGTLNTQTSVPTKDSGGGTAVKPTAEQIRYAQLLNSTEDQRRLQEQIRMVADVTGRNPDDVSVALHDCNFDTEQTINSLLEGRFDQGEWKVTSSRKKKPQTTTTSQGIDSIITNTAPPIAPKSGSRPPRGGGKSSGKGRQSNENSDTDHVNGHMRDDRSSGELGRGRGTREERWSGERRPGGRGGFRFRGGMSGRGGGRPGRSFGSRGRPNRSGGGGRGFVNSSQTENLPLENGTELWDSVDEENKKAESWERKPSEDWGAEEWCPQIPEVTVPSTDNSLFNSVPSSSSSWPDHPQDTGSSWDAELDAAPETDTYNKSENSDPYSPENVDMAVIHSKLAKSSQHNGSPGGVSEFPVPPIPLPGQARGDEIDPISKLLEKAGRVAQEQAVAATRTSQLQTQSQPLPPRQPRGNRPKRTQRSQIPNKAVEMPGSMADSLDVQFGNLEFGGDSVASPKKKQDTPVTVPSVEEIEAFDKSDAVIEPCLDIPSQHRELTSKNHKTKNHRHDLTNQTDNITSQCQEMNTQQHDLTGQLHGVQRRDLTSQQQELGIEQLGVKSQLNDTANQHCNIASLSSSLSITSPAVSVATTASASSSVSTHEESSQRHFQHSLPRDRQTSHMSKMSMDPIALPSSKLVSRESVHPTKPSIISNRAQTPPSITSSLSSVARSQSSPASGGALSQLSSVPTNESTLDSRSYQLALFVQQHGVNQTTISSKDQLSSVIDSTSSLGSSALSSSVQRNEMSRTEPAIPPPPGVHVPFTATHGHTTAAGTLTTVTTTSAKPLAHTSKPSFPPGVLPLNHLYGMQQGLIHAYPMPYGYEDLQRLPMSPYYDVQFQSASREALPGTYQADQKFGRSDASSPVPSTLSQAVTPGQPHLQQQAFINATMPPYGYGGLAFYPGAGMMPGGFPTYQPPPMYQVLQLNTEGTMPAKTHSSGSQYQTAGYSSQPGSHTFGSSGYDDLGPTHDFGKSGGYHSSVSQSQSKSTSGSIISPSTDLSGTTYKGQYNESKAFLGGTPPPALNLPVAGQHGHLNTGFPPNAPFLSLMAPAQQHHHPSLFHHQHMPHQHLETGQSASSHSQRGQQSQSSKQSQSKGHQQSVYQQTPFWSGTN